MKFEEMHIHYSNESERVAIFKKLNEMGFKFTGSEIRDHDCIVSTYSDGNYLTIWNIHNKLSFNEFMQKYGKNEMKEKINQALTYFKFNKEQLSIAIGMSKPYITKMLKNPQSEATQKKVIGLIDKLYIGNSDFFNNQQIENFQVNQLRDEVHSLTNSNNNLNSELNSLRKTLDHKDQVLDKRNDMYEKLELKVADLERSIEVWKGECFSVQSDLDEVKKEKDGMQLAFDKVVKMDNLALSDMQSKIKKERIIFVIVFAIMCAILLASHWVV